MTSPGDDRNERERKRGVRRGPASRSDAIARALREDILRGRIRPGERLPSERELAARTGANRSSAREALKGLEHQGLIEIRPGGARVIPFERASLDVLGHLLEVSGRLDPALVAQSLDVQEILAAGAVRFAVERAAPEELDRAQALLRRLVAPETGDEDYVQAMDELEELIYSASRNLVMSMVKNGLRSVFSRLLPVGSAPPRPSRSVLVSIAGTIADALAARDAVGAEEGVRRLLRAHGERVLKKLEEAASAA